MRASKLLCGLVLAALIIGCQGVRLPYHHFMATNALGWTVTDTLRFAPVTVNSDGQYTITAGVRVDDRYAYRDLWLVIEHRCPEALQPAHRDTVHLILADSQGKWLTQGVVLHETNEMVTTRALTTKDAHEFLVYHIMNDQSLVGVNEVGLKIE